MKTQKLSVWLAFVALIASFTSLPAKDIPGSKDNPLLKRFEGAEIVAYKARNYDTLTFFEKDLAKGVPVEGQMIRIIYAVAPNKTSSLEVFRNYEEELKSKGFEILHAGSTTALNATKEVVQNAVQQGGFVPDFWSGAYDNAYDISAIKRDPAGDVHLRVAVVEMTGQRGGLDTGQVGILVDSIQVKPVAKKMTESAPAEPAKPVAANTPLPAPAPPATPPRAAEMAKTIAATGRVDIYGIYFDFNKTDIKPQSKPTLDEIAKLLTNDARLKLLVIGHTDHVGTAEYNNTLSLRRAQAVVAELTAAYRIGSDRLVASGAGFTKPVASNDTEEGRAKNRRVELVKM